ncbi:MAG: hypothetical protein KatS3mg111_1473 [Pirellulaceae bacterium]|nr:MAG: hypothetical protein KatS3mg111_1473 [Pirellulaceae bacterium]
MRRIEWNAAILLVFGLGAFTAAVLVWEAWQAAPTPDEMAHLASGVSHWRYSRFELYRVNPPLARLVATAPVELLGLVDTDIKYDVTSVGRQEFPAGRTLSEELGERMRLVLFVARLGSLLFFFVGAWGCYVLGRMLYDRRAGWAATVMWLGSPNILGHANLVTPDVAAAAMGTWAMAGLVSWYRRADAGSAYLAGLGLAGALAVKSTWILLPLVFVAVALVGWCRDLSLAAHGAGVKRVWWQSLWRWSWQLGLIAGVSWIAIHTVYGFRGVLRPLGEFHFISDLLAGEKSVPPDEESRPSSNRFRGTWLEHVPCPLPADYLIGIDVQRWDFESDRPNYLNGQWKRGQGWWYYYLYAASVKMPVGYLILMFVAVPSFWMRRWPRGEVWVVVVVLVLWTFISSQTGLNRHFRYMFPALPLMYVLTGRMWWYVPAQQRQRMFRGGAGLGGGFARDWRATMRGYSARDWWGAMRGYSARDWRATMRGLAVLVCVGVVESLWCAPHCLSFFNCLVGGPRNGHYHLLNSNLAWGQDMWRLVEWQREDPQGRQPLYLLSRKNLDSSYHGLVTAAIDDLTEGDDLREPLPRGWYAVDANVLMGEGPGSLGQGSLRGAAVSRLREILRSRQPDARAGYSIFLYYVDSASAPTTTRSKTASGFEEKRQAVE